MDIIPQGIQKYVEAHTTPENELLGRINRETHAKVLRPRMLSGHLQGRLLSMISCMVKPRRVLEIGTYTGYSAICLAEGLTDDGKLLTIDVNEELEDRVKGYFSESRYAEKIVLRIGDALEIINTLDETYDLVFIDADKENYSRYYEAVLPKVAIGGIILADNVLWSGKVLESKSDKDTAAIQEFNRRIQHDNRVENVLLPVRDGIMMIRKISL